MYVFDSVHTHASVITLVLKTFEHNQSINQSINQKRIRVTKVTNVTARPLLLYSVLINEGSLK